MPKCKTTPKSGQGKRTKKVRSPAQYFAQPKRKRESLQKAAHVLSAMRTEGISLHAASREHSVSPRTVQRHAGPALQKTSRGTYKARKSDRLLRVLVLPTPGGLAEIATMDSRAATMVAEYWNAVNLYLETGDDTDLARFRGHSIIDAQDDAVPLLTDLYELERLGSAGVLSFQSLYAKAS
jgi:hypothetical protein